MLVRLVGPASEGGWTISALRPGAAPCCPTVPGSPHLWWCFGSQPGRVRPRRKLKANSAANEAQTFFDATLPQRFGGDLGRSASVCARKVGRWAKKAWAADPGPRRKAREGASPSLFLANSSAPVRKNSFQCVADSQDVFVGIAPGRRKRCKSCRKSFAQKRPPGRVQESWEPARHSRGGMPRNRLGESPAQSSPLTSNPRVNNLPQSALETHKRSAAVGWRGPDAEPARKAAPWRAQPQS